MTDLKKTDEEGEVGEGGINLDAETKRKKMLQEMSKPLLMEMMSKMSQPVSMEKMVSEMSQPHKFKKHYVVNATQALY